MRETLCWECARATGGCSWSREFIPVKGWKAKKTKIKDERYYRYYSSYLVLKCPLFVPDDFSKNIMFKKGEKT
jgi:hypothetical protein